ncbi:hypothetical protein A0H81_08726 [Grifola frondosa]|uniref:Uncharacterized protein n=1 Tax=Grifola frondosa TaxID=5627 RepID=A0A1C7M5R2_GRIFR|nr:hypothetical protein A0H81_08726 [Grifola frondosa]
MCAKCCHAQPTACGYQAHDKVRSSAIISRLSSSPAAVGATNDPFQLSRPPPVIPLQRAPPVTTPTIAVSSNHVLPPTPQSASSIILQSPQLDTETAATQHTFRIPTGETWQKREPPEMLRVQDISTWPTFNISQVPELLLMFTLSGTDQIEVYNLQADGDCQRDPDEGQRGVCVTIAMPQRAAQKRRLDSKAIEDDSPSRPLAAAHYSLSHHSPHVTSMASPVMFSPVTTMCSSPPTSPAPSSSFGELSPAQPLLPDDALHHTGLGLGLLLPHSSAPDSLQPLHFGHLVSSLVSPNTPLLTDINPSYDALWAAGVVYVPPACYIVKWPNAMYARDVRKAFTLLGDLINKGQVADQFEQIFPGITYKSSTFYRQFRAWRNSQESEHQWIMEQPRTAQGLWTICRAKLTGWQSQPSHH